MESGSTEFALQVYDQTTGQAGPRLLPNPRFLSGSTARGHWRHSGPLEFLGRYSLRISARILTDGRIEFAVQQRSADNGWAERILPHQRMFTANPQVGQWLVSSYVRFPQATYVPIANGKGRFSYTGHYFSNVFRGVIGTGLRNFSQTWDIQLSLLCQYGFNISLLGLPEFDADPVDVTLSFSNGMTTTSAWRRYDTTILQSPDPWVDFDRLRQAEFVSVDIPGLLPVAQEFDLTDMFTTPIQENLEHCGNYAPGETREFPPTSPSYRGGRLTTFNGSMSEALWHWWREPGTLSRVTLEEELLRLPSDGAGVSNEVGLSLNMTCDSQGLVIQLSGSELEKGTDVAGGSKPVFQVLADGEALDDVVWRSGSGLMYPQDGRDFFDAVRQATRLQVRLAPDDGETLAFDLSALFDTPAQEFFDQCAEHPKRTEATPYTDADQWVRSNIPGVGYRIGTGNAQELDWWTLLILDEQSAWSGAPSGHQEMRLTCGLDGIAIQLRNVGSGQPVFLRAWPAHVEVSWRTDVKEVTESWDVWDLEFHQDGFSLSPPNDRAFFEQIHGADSLTIDVPTEPHPVTLYFTLGEIGVWDTPAAINLEACDHGGLEPG
ncbi:MAG: hypothetical protein F4038_08715 [Chloroflexi bacterium]|nr:hypothetical protein [Chloroflexota bacterium]MYJ93113.1 hypothetical protein [Chloroflexota bacterium]